METIKFSCNWNNKLNNSAFTTIRLHNQRKYIKNNHYLIDLKGYTKGIAVLKGICVLKISELNDYITYLDTGYNLTETTKILQNMYKNINLESQLFDLCLLVYEKDRKENDLFSSILS